MSEKFAPLYVSGTVEGNDNNGWAIVMITWRGDRVAVTGWKNEQEALDAVRVRLTWARDDD